MSYDIMSNGKIVVIISAITILIAIGAIFAISSSDSIDSESIETEISNVEEPQGVAHSVSLTESIAVSSNPP